MKRTPAKNPTVALQTAPGRIEIFVRGEAFAAYCYADGETPGFAALYAPGRREVTQPVANGRALWLAHGDVNGVAFGEQGSDGMGGSVLPEGDAHGVAPTAGQIETEEMLVRRGTYSAGFQHVCGWLAPGRKRLLTVTNTVRALPGPGEGAILDIHLQLQSEDHPVTLGRTEAALLCLRAARALFGGQPLAGATGLVRSSAGAYGAGNIHGRAARWCACVGVVQSETVGFAFLEHPGNTFFPSPWLATPAGVLSPSPFLSRSLELPPRSLIALRYRLLVHPGYVDQDWADARLTDFARDVAAA